ncbi:hypothetical protein SAMN05444166_6549 [Singulisphaera sp. GP187]|nr:hypothetical protein SAMN05444166_6549 [Singulisphaera sp. GP187]
MVRAGFVTSVTRTAPVKMGAQEALTRHGRIMVDLLIRCKRSLKNLGNRSCQETMSETDRSSHPWTQVRGESLPLTGLG